MMATISRLSVPPTGSVTTTTNSEGSRCGSLPKQSLPDDDDRTRSSSGSIQISQHQLHSIQQLSLTVKSASSLSLMSDAEFSSGNRHADDDENDTGTTSNVEQKEQHQQQEQKQPSQHHHTKKPRRRSQQLSRQSSSSKSLARRRAIEGAFQQQQQIQDDKTNTQLSSSPVQPYNCSSTLRFVGPPEVIPPNPYPFRPHILWHSYDEYQEFKLFHTRLVKVLNKGTTTVDTTNDKFFSGDDGMAVRNTAQIQNSRKIIKKTVQAVLKEQNILRQEARKNGRKVNGYGFSSDALYFQHQEYIMIHYQQYTIPCAKAAIQVAKINKKDIKEYQADTRKEWPDKSCQLSHNPIKAMKRGWKGMFKSSSSKPKK